MRQSADAPAPASGDRSITPMHREERGPGPPRRSRSLARPALGGRGAADPAPAMQAAFLRQAAGPEEIPASAGKVLKQSPHFPEVGRLPRSGRPP